MDWRNRGRGRAMRGAITTVALLCAAACLSAAVTATSPSAAPIVIGVSNAQSGHARAFGRELVNGSQAYFDQVNRAGGIRGRKIRMDVLDDRYEPEPAVSNTNQLITRDQALFLFDYVGTPTLTRVLPLLRYYDTENVINLAPMTGAAPQRRPPYDRYVFNIRASYGEEAEAIVDYLYAQGCRRFGFFGQADAYGKSGETAVADALRPHGLSIVESVSYHRGTPVETSMKMQVEILRARNIDAVISFSTCDPAAAFVRDVRLAGWQVPVAHVSFVNADLLLRTLQHHSKALQIDLTQNLVASQVLPQLTDNCSLVTNFLESTPESVHNSAALEGWLNATVATAALQRVAGEINRVHFRAALESLHNWDAGLGVALHFSAADHQALHAVWLMTARNSQWVSLGRFLEAK